jgi:3-hydroxyacyl-[acyl-carrier-protein] dehydratase
MTITAYIKSNLRQTSDRAGKIVLNYDFPGFAGHFPGNPIVPGAALIEMSVLLASKIKQRNLNLRVINKVKFMLPVVPNDELLFLIEFQCSSHIRAAAFKGDAKVCTIQMEVN